MRFVQKIKNIIPTKRKLVQVYAGLLFNANLKGFLSGSIYKGDTKVLCSPGINCYSCPGAVGACPLGSLQGSLSSDAVNHGTLFYVGGILLLYSIMLGRMICGWLCPFGFIQELLYKIPTPKLPKNRFTRVLSYLKYLILVFFVFVVPIAYACRNIAVPAFCKYICPAGTIEGGLLLLSHKVNASKFAMLGPLFTWKFLLMISIVVGCIFCFRLFCRFLCPLGALYGLFNRISFLGIKVEESKCVHCNLCTAHCKMDVKNVGDQECISCGECINVCPTNAIKWKGTALLGKIGIPYESTDGTSHGSKKARNISRAISTGLLIALVIGALSYCWITTPDYVAPAEGNEVGDSCPSYDLTVITKDGIQTDSITLGEAGANGKITIINFWGTWCGPCKAELPYFNQIANEYADAVTVVAIHTNTIANTAPAYIAETYPDSNMIFAMDIAEEGYYTMLGGRDTYPYTVVLDEHGVIVKIFVEALEYEDLKEIVEKELSN